MLVRIHTGNRKYGIAYSSNEKIVARYARFRAAEDAFNLITGKKK